MERVLKDAEETENITIWQFYYYCTITTTIGLFFEYFTSYSFNNVLKIRWYAEYIFFHPKAKEVGIQ